MRCPARRSAPRARSTRPRSNRSAADGGDPRAPRPGRRLRAARLVRRPRASPRRPAAGALARPAVRIAGLAVVYLPLVLLLGAALEPSQGVEQLLAIFGAPLLALLTLAALGGYRALGLASGLTVLAYAVDVDRRLAADLALPAGAEPGPRRALLRDRQRARGAARRPRRRRHRRRAGRVRAAPLGALGRGRLPRHRPRLRPRLRRRPLRRRRRRRDRPAARRRRRRRRRRDRWTPHGLC